MALRRPAVTVVVDRMEGDLSTTDDEDDLDTGSLERAQARLKDDLKSAPPQSTPEHDRRPKPIPSPGLSSSGRDGGDTTTSSDADVPRSPKSRRLHALSHQQKDASLAQEGAVEWSSAEDAQALPSTRKRKRPEKRLLPVKQRKKRPRQIAYGIVGKKESRPKPEARKARNANSYSDTDDERLDREMPEYLKQRRASFNAAQEELREAGLRLPPSFDDIAFSDDERLASLAEKPAMTDMSPRAPYEDLELSHSKGVIPAPVAQWLHPYQVEGINFLHKAFVYQRGVILGDDMGLGKTIQVIGFLLAAFGKTGDERDSKRMRKIRRLRDKRWYPRVLLICPGSLMDNWTAELDRWSWFSTDRFHGLGKEGALQAATSGRIEIMITTYTTYTNNRDAINKVAWDAVVADEVHKIKTYEAESTQAMNEVNAMCRIGLTGTAIQNNYDELWTLLNWANPGRLGPRRVWKTHISDPLKLGQSHDATEEQLSVARTTAKKLAFNLLPRFFLRRTKKLIAQQLPKKTERVVFCPLTDDQKDAYINYVGCDTVEHIRSAVDPCGCRSGSKFGWCCGQYLANGQRWQTAMFPCMQNCRKMADHLAMMIPQSSDTQEAQAKALDNLQEAMPHAWRSLYDSRDRIETYASPKYCGKWTVLQKLLQFWYDAGDTKVLIFSHAVRLLKMFRQLFVARSSFTLHYLDGSMPYETRTEVVDEFNSDPNAFAFLISTNAGGVGLNITSANKVVILDPSWNPAMDMQAQDRAYRIGQHRDVEVFRLVSAGTIEEIVYARQIYKQQQASIAFTATDERRYFKGVQDKRDRKGEIFGLKNLFRFQDDVVLQGIVNKLNIAEARAGFSVAGLDLESSLDDDGAADAHAAAATLGKSSSRRNRQGDDEAMQAFAHAISQGLDDEDQDPTAAHKDRPRGKASAIAAILARAGVTYSHETSDVLGSSRVEAGLSARALEGSARAGRVFAASSSQPDAIPSSPPPFPTPAPAPASPAATNNTDAPTTDIPTIDAAAPRPPQRKPKRYRPPQPIRHRQFCSMAAAHGFTGADGVAAFALLVEGWSARRRRAALDEFYRARCVGGGREGFAREESGQVVEGDAGREEIEGEGEEDGALDEILDLDADLDDET